MPIGCGVVVCMTDSDGDGVTNGEELGDPCCLWTPDSPSPKGFRVTNLSHPGDSEEDGANSAPKCEEEEDVKEDEKPVDEKPADEEPADEKPVDKKSADEKPVDKKSVEKKPVETPEPKDGYVAEYAPVATSEPEEKRIMYGAPVETAGSEEKKHAYDVEYTNPLITEDANTTRDAPKYSESEDSCSEIYEKCSDKRTCCGTPMTDLSWEVRRP